MKKQIMTSDEFTEGLIKANGHFRGESQVIRGNLRLQGDEINLTYIHVENVTFQDMVTIYGFKRGRVSIGFESVNFLDILTIEQCGGGSGNIQICGCHSKQISLWSSRLESVFISGVEIDRSIDLSGLMLNEALSLIDVKTTNLEIMHSSHMGRIKTPLVKTNNPLFAEQFLMACIPVFMSTENTRKMMEAKSGYKSML